MGIFIRELVLKYSQDSTNSLCQSRGTPYISQAGFVQGTDGQAQCHSSQTDYCSVQNRAYILDVMTLWFHTPANHASSNLLYLYLRHNDSVVTSYIF